MEPGGLCGLDLFFFDGLSAFPDGSPLVLQCLCIQTHIDK